MEGLLTFLVFGGLFFLMMRYGCGAHMAHGGHGGHAGHDSHAANEAISHTDPVCGMDVDMTQGYGKMYEGQLYRFCSRKCLDRFEENPEKYLNQAAADSRGVT